MNITIYNVWVAIIVGVVAWGALLSGAAILSL